MKLAVVGLGQCGGRIADEFAQLNRRARVQRGIDIVTGAFAINTDIAFLSCNTAANSSIRALEFLDNVSNGLPDWFIVWGDGEILQIKQCVMRGYPFWLVKTLTPMSLRLSEA